MLPEPPRPPGRTDTNDDRRRRAPRKFGVVAPPFLRSGPARRASACAARPLSPRIRLAFALARRLLSLVAQRSSINATTKDLGTDDAGAGAAGGAGLHAGQ